MSQEDVQMDLFAGEQSKVQLMVPLYEAQEADPALQLTEPEPEPIVAYGYTQSELDAPVFEDGPSRLEVEQWKEKFGDVYFTPFGEKIFIWRTIKRPEYRQILADKSLSTMDREEVFCERCVLFPRNYTRTKMAEGDAGIPSLISEMLMDKSGFVASSAPIKL
jgi:hypothetical protein